MAKKASSSVKGRVVRTVTRSRGKTVPRNKKVAPKASRPSSTDRYGFSALPSVYEVPQDSKAAANLALVPTGQEALSLVSSDRFKTRLSPVSGQAPSQLKPLPLETSERMDPRLQLALANFRTGKTGPTLASTADDEIAVIARVSSIEEWEAIPDVDPGTVLGATEDGKGWIVTGRLQVDRAEAVRSNEHVLSLKASQFIQPSLNATVEAMQVAPSALPTGTRSNGGSGVVVGIVDFGCDFAHENFCQNGKTRLLALWHQSGQTRSGSDVKYGTLYSRKEINAALRDPNPYAALGYGPGKEKGGAHGTHVMDIAVGNGSGTGIPGVAPKADIVFVEAAVNDIAWHGHTTVNSSFGDSAQLLEAVRFVFDTAGDRPCVCNISLGTNGGPHDGTSLVEQGLDAIVREKPNRAIVIAAGNAQTHNIHTSAIVSKHAPHKIEWRQQNAGGGEFELWYSATRRLAVTLITSDGTQFGPVEPGDSLGMTGASGEMCIFISTRLNDPNNGDNMIGIWIAEGLSENNFVVELTTTNDEGVEYHAWMERNGNKQSSFVNPVHSHTLGSISTGRETIVVGSFDGHKSKFPISSFSSAGPTRDGRPKPDVAAPGQFVHAAMSGTSSGVTKKSGTSMAAPAVAGLIALIYSDAHRAGKNLSISALRKKLLSGVSVSPPNLSQPEGWDDVYGFGRANGRSVKI